LEEILAIMIDNIYRQKKLLDELFLNWLHNPFYSPYD